MATLPFDVQARLDIWHRRSSGEDIQWPREPWQDALDEQIKEWEQDLDAFFASLAISNQTYKSRKRRIIFHGCSLGTRPRTAVEKIIRPFFWPILWHSFRVEIAPKIEQSRPNFLPKVFCLIYILGGGCFRQKTFSRFKAIIRQKTHFKRPFRRNGEGITFRRILNTRNQTQAKILGSILTAFFIRLRL